MELMRPVFTVLIIFCALAIYGVRINYGWKPAKSKLVKYLGSLHLAVLLLAAMTVLLSVATFLESKHGTAYVLKVVYRAQWFELILIGIFLNIFFATVLRLPYRKSKLGFYLTHLGILTILLGSLMTRLGGIEGTMTLLEGQKGSKVILPGNALQVYHKGKQVYSAEVGAEVGAGDSFEIVSQYAKDGSPSTLQLVLKDSQEHSELSHQYKPYSREELPTPTFLNPALKFQIKSSMFNLDQWMVFLNPDLNNPSLFQMGPATIRLEVREKAQIDKALADLGLKDKKDPELRISFDKGESFQTIPISREFPKEYALEDGSTLTITSVFQNATVSKERGIMEHEGPGTNPAITFLLKTADGKTQDGVRFEKHPDFQGAHNEDGLETIIEIENLAKPRARGELRFMVDRDNPEAIYYRVESSKQIQGGPLKLNKLIPLGWNDAVLVVKEFIPRAKVERVITPKKLLANAKSSLPYVEVGYQLPNQKQESSFKLIYGEQKKVQDSEFTVYFGEFGFGIPFEVKLKDFRKTDYPNTSRAMEYASDVQIIDDHLVGGDRKEFETTISMNNVLDYAGWRFFQSSFRIDGTKEYSTFQVAKDPGIETIYLGSIIMVLGIGLMFWWKPQTKKTSNEEELA